MRHLFGLENHSLRCHYILCDLVLRLRLVWGKKSDLYWRESKWKDERSESQREEYDELVVRQNRYSKDFRIVIEEITTSVIIDRTIMIGGIGVIMIEKFIQIILKIKIWMVEIGWVVIAGDRKCRNQTRVEIIKLEGWVMCIW